MSDIRSATGLVRILAEVRERRRNLHDLVGRMQRDRLAWEEDLAAMERRPHLTPAQRNRFHRHLTAFLRRRAR